MSASRARLTRPRLTRGSGQHSVHRGTGDAITSASSRVTGLIAPIIAVCQSPPSPHPFLSRERTDGRG